jgi:inorganic pyrophosphatase
MLRLAIAVFGVLALLCVTFAPPTALGSQLFVGTPPVQQPWARVPVSGSMPQVEANSELPYYSAPSAQSTSRLDAGLLGWGLLGFSAVAMMSIVASSSGEGLDFKMFFKKDGAQISPWHDIPAYTENKDELNFVCEIPKYGTAKMECDTKGESNPIIQDSKKGKARFYHGPIFWNYGYVPQTWEDPSAQTKGYAGDGDPLDVVELGSTREMGSVHAVKPLGVLAMIDEGEIDWKMIAIAKDDPLAEKLNDISDVEDRVISGIREWFRWYKTPDDKPLNEFEFDEEALPKAKALEVVAETHESWQKLKDGTTEKGKMWVS